METRRLILFILLAFVILVLWNWILGPKPPAEQKVERPKEAVEHKEERGAVSQPAGPGPAAPPLWGTLRPDKAPSPSREVVVDTPLARVTFTSQGGSIKSFRLKRYKDIPRDLITAKERLLSKEGKGQLSNYQRAKVLEKLSLILRQARAIVQGSRPDAISKNRRKELSKLTKQFSKLVLQFCNDDFLRRRKAARRLRGRVKAELSSHPGWAREMREKIEVLEGVELVPPYLAEVGEPMLATVYRLGQKAAGATGYELVPFGVTGPETIRLEPGSTCTIRFRASFDGGRLRLVKEYRISAQSYGFDVSYRLEAGSASTVVAAPLQTWLGPDVGSVAFEGKSRYSAGGLVAFDGSSIETEDFAETTRLVWAGISDRYFIVSVAAGNRCPVSSVPLLSGHHLSWSMQLRPGSVLKTRVYAGPKAMEELRKEHMGLERVVDFGWFSFIATPLFYLLKFLYSVTGNYGVAIILLTILMKLLFYPLTIKQTRSMKKMQKIAPEVKRLRDKYKNDRDRLNREIMALYKKHDVNPMGGCLPMLVQFPILIALIKVLPVVIELRQAPFVLWLKDLSEPDPYYITPILMGAAMMVQQKMTPSTGDPKQAKMMLLLPVLFTFFFLNFSSGLVLYWFVSTLLQIGQQMLMERSEKKVAARS